MSKFVVVGAGATGSRVAEELARVGHQVAVVSRHGSGPRGEGISLAPGDASDSGFLTEITRGSAALFNCANPPYHRWSTDWPPISEALLATAEQTGATLVTLSNLYAYGQPTGPMTPHDPLASTLPKAQVRAAMWNDALARHEAGKISAVEVRASDFLGATTQSQFSRVVPRLVRGKGVRVVGDPDAPHSWTFVGDVARTMVACAVDRSTWGRPWHVPSNEPRSSRQVVEGLCEAAGVAPVSVASVPPTALRALGVFSPLLREVPKTLYQFESPFVMDDSETRQELGLVPTAWPDVLAATVAPYLPGDREARRTAEAAPTGE